MEASYICVVCRIDKQYFGFVQERNGSCLVCITDTTFVHGSESK